jgi:fructokinase
LRSNGGRTKMKSPKPAAAEKPVASTRRFTVLGLGELLWDLLPAGKQLGGAPANFAYMTALLGDRAVVVSRVGKDRLGNAAARRLTRLGLSSAFLQVDTGHPTSTVNVTVDERGQPQFEILSDVAWDFFEWTPQWQALAAEADAVCYGSLAQRLEQSRTTIRAFLEALRPGALRIFDVNLRQAFFTKEILSESANRADIMKLNDDEIMRVTELLGGPAGDEQSAARWLLKKYGIKLVCITRGGKGSLLVTPEAADEHPGFAIKVADTVGAGDAFTAALVHQYLRKASLRAMNAAANRLGSWVASQVGATPPADPQVILEFHNSNEEGPAAWVL